MISNDRYFLEYSSYLRKKAKINPKFATQQVFAIDDECIKKCREYIDSINQINIEIKKITKSKDKAKERNELNRKKGKALENLAKELLNSSSIFDAKPNLRDTSNEIDLLLIPSDYNALNECLLPKYLKNDILVECKNYNETIKVDWVGKFASLANTHSVELGIIFSYKKFAGKYRTSFIGLSKKIFLYIHHQLQIPFE